MRMYIVAEFAVKPKAGFIGKLGKLISYATFSGFSCSARIASLDESLEKNALPFTPHSRDASLLIGSELASDRFHFFGLGEHASGDSTCNLAQSPPSASGTHKSDDVRNAVDEIPFVNAG